MKRRALIIMLVLSLLISASGVVTMAADAATVATIDGFAYTSLQAAVTAVNNGEKDGMIRLEKDAAQENIEVNGNVYVDLNGNDIGSVTVNSGAFYGTDSQTNDFTVEDTEGCGTIGSFTGDVQAAFSPVDDGYGYVMIKEGSKASFHYVELRITDMTLRPMNEEKTAYNPSVYYKCAFVGDEVVAANVETFGVALSLRGKPSLVGLDKCGCSVFENFAPGENGNAEQSTVLEDIMQESNLYHINKRNAGMKVYGQAYLQLKNGGGYIFGKCEARNLQEQTEGANKLWTVLNSEEKDSIKGLYNQYKAVMQSWNLTGITKPYADVVEDAVTWYEEFQNLPTVYDLKNESGEYDVDELRQLVVDTFRLQLSLKWTPNETFVYHSNKVDNKGNFTNYTTLATGGVFKGMPYCIGAAYHVVDGQDVLENGSPKEFNFGAGNMYKALNYYDPATGVMDITKMGDAQNVFNILTSNCGGGLNWALSRVSNATKLFDTSHFTPANGALPVGEYTLDESQFTTVNTRGEIVYVANAVQSIIDANSKAKMYRSYAELQPGDILLTDGHVRMCVGVAVDWPEGATYPNAATSYVYYIDQNSYGSVDRWAKEGGDAADHVYRQDGNNALVRDLGGMRDHLEKGENEPVYTKISFYDLRNGGYIPLTIPEFCSQAELEAYKNKAAAQFVNADKVSQWTTYYEPAYDAIMTLRGIEEGSITSVDGLENYKEIKPNTLCSFTGNFTASYLISNFHITIKDQNGKVVREENPPVNTGDRSKTNVGFKSVRDVSEVLKATELAQYVDKGYTIKIDAMLGTGEWLEVMNAVISSTNVMK